MTQGPRLITSVKLPGTKVLISPIKEEEVKTIGGVILPYSVISKEPPKAVVMAKGPGTPSKVNIEVEKLRFGKWWEKFIKKHPDNINLEKNDCFEAWCASLPTGSPNDMSEITCRNVYHYKRGAGIPITVNETECLIVDYSDLILTL